MVTCSLTVFALIFNEVDLTLSSRIVREFLTNLVLNVLLLLFHWLNTCARVSATFPTSIKCIHVMFCICVFLFQPLMLHLFRVSHVREIFALFPGLKVRETEQRA